jgi:hypothetical protein
MEKPRAKRDLRDGAFDAGIQGESAGGGLGAGEPPEVGRRRASAGKRHGQCRHDNIEGDRVGGEVLEDGYLTLNVYVWLEMAGKEGGGWNPHWSAAGQRWNRRIRR